MAEPKKDHALRRPPHLSGDPDLTGLAGGELFWHSGSKEFRFFNGATSGADFSPLAPDVPFGPFVWEGPLALHTGTKRYYWRGNGQMKLISVAGFLEVPGSGNLRVDVNKNGTTIHTTQTNRLNLNTGNGGVDTITASNIEVNDVTPGDYFTFDIDAGVGGPPAGLVVTLFLRRASV